MAAPDAGARGPRRPPRTLTVKQTTRLNPGMVRIVLEGEELADFSVGEYTDHYVKCRFGEKTRTYTVRAFDPGARELTLDFVVHGDAGLAGPWAARAKPGDTLMLNGPGGGYHPSPDADWHLLVGDESVIPAISVALEKLPAGIPAYVIIEVAGPEDEQQLQTDADLHLSWLHRGHVNVRTPQAQLDAVRSLELPPGRGQAFVHGEASAVLEVRRHLIADRGISREQLSASGYWKQRLTDEQWREQKREWIAQADAGIATA